MMKDKEISEIRSMTAVQCSYFCDMEIVRRTAKLLQNEFLKLRLVNYSERIDNAEWRYKAKIVEALEVLEELTETLEDEAETYIERHLEIFKKENP